MKQIILAILISFNLWSCNKDDDSTCEQWRVQEWIKEGKVYLSQPTTSDKTICNGDIKSVNTTYVCGTKKEM